MWKLGFIIIGSDITLKDLYLQPFVKNITRRQFLWVAQRVLLSLTGTKPICQQ
jgi:hypothetical protein